MPSIDTRPKCYYCERGMLMPDHGRKKLLLVQTRDHVVPQSRGGRGNKENIVLCCKQCNGSKGSKSLWQWECFLSGRLPAKSKNEEWSLLRPLMIVNIKKHPLYKPEIDFNSFREFRSDGYSPIRVNKSTKFDPYNFHEEYVQQFKLPS